MPSGLWPRAHGRGSPSLQPWSSLPSCPRVPAVPAPGVVATVPRPSSRPWLRASPPFTRRLWSTQRLTAAAVGRTLTRQSLPIRAARAPMPAPTSRRTAASRRRPKVIPAAATLSPATRRLPFRSAPNPTSVPTQRPSLMAFTRRRSKTVGCPWPSTARCCRSMPVRCGCSTGCGGTETGPGVSMPCMALRLPSGFLSRSFPRSFLMATFLVWAAMALSPLAGGQTASCGVCTACECCGCCESGTCSCSACRCTCCEAGASQAEGCCTVSAGADRAPQAEQAGCCGSGCCK